MSKRNFYFETEGVIFNTMFIENIMKNHGDS